MGGMSKCKKILADIKRVDRINVTTSDIENYVKQLKLYPGAFIQYSDDDGSRRMSGIANFVVIDHICLSPSDIRFVIRCDSDPTRILAVSRIHAYDVRGRYDVSSYRCFHPLERYIYTIIAVSYTHLDVYKRQEKIDSGRHRWYKNNKWHGATRCQAKTR